MKIDKNTTLAEFTIIEQIVNFEKINELFERLKSRPKPQEIAGAKLPENLNLITWAQFAQLSSLDNSEQSFFAPFEIILGLKKENLTTCKLFDIIGFLIFIRTEIERLAKLFEQIKYQPSPEEIQAEIDKLNFGLFGTLDWFARRMGFADHAQAEQMPLGRIYKCLEIDSKTAAYEKRLRKIIENKNKPKKLVNK